MIEVPEEKRESWGTRGAFIFAAIGSAVGLGNLWAFPYKLYSFGGAAFLIPYITAIFCIGIPLLILEFSLGHFTQRAAPDAFARTNRKFETVGWWGVLLGFVIVTYYPVILAYCFSFLWISLQSIISGQPLPWAGQGVEGVEKARQFFFDTYLGYSQGFKFSGIRWHIAIMLLVAWVAMYLSIFRGVKLLGKVAWITVPLPWLMLLVLTVRGLTLEGSTTGLVYYLEPDWSRLAEPETWRYAFGQVFFSLSLAFGVMVTYASFLHRRSDLNNNAAIIGIADFATSFIAGLAIFSTLGGMAYITATAGNPIPVEELVTEGTGLAFVAFPYALAQLPGAAWWSFVFFFILVTLGVNSAFSITETVLASIVDKTGWHRWIVLPVMSLIGLGIGLLFVTHTGLNWLGTIDGFINGTWGIAFLGLLECVVLGWGYRIENLRNHANDRSDWNLGRWWNWLLRIFIPVVLGTLFVWNLIEDFAKPEGFLYTPAGQPHWQNWAGLAVIALAPVLAVILTLVKNPQRTEQPQEYEPEKAVTRPSFIGGITVGLTVLALAIFATLPLTVGLVIFKSSTATAKILLGFSACAAIVGLFIANWVMDCHDKNSEDASWFARVAGIICILEVSVFTAFVLYSATRVKKLPLQVQDVLTTQQHLGSTAYVILSVVGLLVAGGLGFCFYRAVSAAGNSDS